jgi:hypothetical protein
MKKAILLLRAATLVIPGTGCAGTSTGGRERSARIKHHFCSEPCTKALVLRNVVIGDRLILSGATTGAQLSPTALLCGGIVRLDMDAFEAAHERGL